MSVNVFSQKKLQKNIKMMNDTTEQANFEPNVLKSISDSVSKDSTIVEAKTIKIADNDLEDNVKYKAQDSIIYDIPNKTVYLYGRATIKYQEMDMAAGFIKFNWDSSEVYAKAMYDDSLGAMKRVEFKDGTGEYVANEAKFNFKTKKGKSLGLVTREMEGYLHGDQVKVIDTNTLYIKNARYTTCDLDDPHFYVEIGKAKVIKDKIMVGKPADIVIAGVRRNEVEKDEFRSTDDEIAGHGEPRHAVLRRRRRIQASGVRRVVEVDEPVACEIRVDGDSEQTSLRVARARHGDCRSRPERCAVQVEDPQGAALLADEDAVVGREGERVRGVEPQSQEDDSHDQQSQSDNAILCSYTIDSTIRSYTQ